MKNNSFLMKMILISLILCLGFSFVASAATISLTIGSTIALVDGKEVTMDVAPEKIELESGGVTFVPVRFVTENFGITNNWNAAARNDVVLTKEGFNAKIVIDSTEAIINGTAKTLLAAPYLNNNRTMVPIRFLSENLGYSVGYDPATQVITISGTDAVQPPAEQDDNIYLGFEFASADSYYIVSGYSGSATELVIPASYKDKAVKEIYFEAFKDCTSLTKITIPNSIIEIGDSAFAGCTNLESVELPDSITEIRFSTFKDCTNLKNITIPDSVTTIGDSAFLGCTNLTNIVIPDSVSNIRWRAFKDCTSLTSITMPDAVTEIGYAAFAGCTSLTNIVIPDSVTTINDSAFLGCTSLTIITIPDSVTAIRWRAFKDCTGLTNIVIPESVTTINYDVFDACDNLTIYCRAAEKPDGWDSSWNGTCPVVWGYTGD